MDALYLEIKRPLIIGDLHFCEFSSIIRKKGLRLTYLVNTLYWIIRTAKENQCDSVFFLGDFFDKPNLNASELTALQEVVWDPSLKYFCLVGNHDLGDSALSCSSTHILNQIPKFEVINKVTLIKNSIDGFDYLMIPYIVDDKDRKLSLYTKDLNKDNLVVLSHNDILGVQIGCFISKEGFEIKDIQNNCKLFLNGHLHNKFVVAQNVFNIGNITGQNFSEDASKYNHTAYILDKYPYIKMTAIENPFAFNFYKIDLSEYDSQLNYLITLPFLQNSILSVKCGERECASIREYLQKHPNILEFRIILSQIKSEGKEDIKELVFTDAIGEFKKYILNNLENSDYLLKELQEI